MRKLLIVDDDEFTRTLLKTIFKDSFDITEAENGRDLVVRAQEVRPDLIITDIVMPVLSGYRAVGRLAREPVFRKTAVIFTSSAVSDHDLYEMYKPPQMVTGFINKPFSRSEITALAEELLEKTSDTSG